MNIVAVRALVLLAAALVVAPSAPAAPPLVSASATPAAGPAPLAVTLTASGDAASYRWSFGDGDSADGAVVVHAYRRPGRYRATVTATGPAGETASAGVDVLAFGVTLAAPRAARYGTRARMTGRVVPAVRTPVTLLRDGAPVATTRSRADGRFRLRPRILAPGVYQAVGGGARSAQRSLLVRPALELRLAGDAVVGAPLHLVARVRPAGAGRLRASVSRGARVVREVEALAPLRLRLDTRRPAALRVRVAVVPAPGFVAAARARAVTVVHPRLARGARGPSVLALERRLRELRFALPRVDRLFALDTYQAVLAFQKLVGLPPTGRVDARTWRRLARARTPRPRYPGTHIEVSKGRQLLFLVRRGRVEAIVHVSTGATGNTPLGHWRVYRKVPGWDWVLWYPLYFLRGFAIHGYPSVPPYPASHGCVRVPMWFAPGLYARVGYGASVYVYW